MVDVLPYGSWPSPLTAEQVSGAAPRLEGARFVGDEVWWGVTLPAEGGRTAVRRRRADGTAADVLPAPWNARSRVHEYGGGAWTASPEGTLYFVEKTDQRVYAVRPGADPEPLTPADGDVRHGGLSWQAGTLLAVREDHTAPGVPRRAIVAIPVDGGAVIELAGGSDFVVHPALSPDRRHLAWVGWNHPDMPWDRARLYVAEMEAGVAVRPVVLTDGETSPLQPVWTDERHLLFSDDPTGRWNLWRRDVLDDAPAQPVAPADADTGGPVWVLGQRWFAPLPDGRIVAVRTHGGDDVVLIDAHGAAQSLGLPLTAGVSVEDVAGTRVLLTGAAPPRAGGVGRPAPPPPAAAQALVGGEPAWAPEWTPIPRAVTVEGPHGPVHAFDYPPTHPGVVAPDGELPPYVVFVHGGPTAHVAAAASGRIAYLTSRGIGVLDVNYGGSSGYGRAYRERLRGQWGVVDVDDVAAAAQGLADAGRADAARLAIAGGSAGGWTVLSALVGTDVFSAGISRYGVGDARTLAEDTHDFEARYLDGLIGPLPEAEAVYVERSPLSRSDRFRVPVLLLQGAEDEVVPPSQSEAIRDALASRGIPHAYVLYEGEGHGFRRAETVVHALESELAFLGQVFGFATPGVPPLELTRAD
ncbi:prolyl oligopeptidase family serine peptidase [Microbacterium sp. zg.Y1090]|uniref:S9 family peptidase n=1 Tax=Microbacterium wangruii TaxID=3049073 RepID=UPI00214B3EE6|nr:prolyl oligopeptidase family serine peptidase [Microbacterium sp. zg.Y1090]MCR2818288.1 prolyl oligopeptidase family serine peptidase [Microbacterium sp. zg.Y1090]